MLFKTFLYNMFQRLYLHSQFYETIATLCSLLADSSTQSIKLFINPIYLNRHMFKISQFRLCNA